MRIYIIGNDGIALSREAPAALNEGEIVVASNEELRAAPLSGKQLLPGVNRSSKQDGVIAMLRRPEGATVDEVVSATGWQRHTVRGVFSGTLKKKLRLTIASAKEERGRVYRVAEPPSA
jgi:hypothetical protein